MNKQKILKNYRKTINEANEFISKSINETKGEMIQQYRKESINLLQMLGDSIEVTDYLLIDSKPIISEQEYIDIFFTLGTLYKSFVETEIIKETEILKKNNLNRSVDVQNKQILLSDANKKLFLKSIECFNMILRIKFENDIALKQIISVYTQLCFFSQHNLNECLSYLQEALLYAPSNDTIHYNLGYIYHKINRLELAIIHYKISLNICENLKNDNEDISNLKINNLNGISSVYRSIKQWPESLHYLLKAEKIKKDDPDIQNQLGVVYTEMRRTDLAENAYNKAISNYSKSFISTDHKFLLSEIYLNLGHMHSYNGDNNKSIENYNKSLKVCPKFSLPFQNKLMNLSYVFDQLEDKKYIYNQHLLVNKLYMKGCNFKFEDDFYKNSDKINIGIISGDFSDHPVSYFISPFLKNFDNDKFTVTCYSECIINTVLFNKNLKFKTIKNKNNIDASNMIYNDNIHILFDLAGHTAFNRLDIFSMKPSPIQITYIGYPYSTGLNEMNYRITDNICDGDFSISKEYYTEELIAIKDCFLCYDYELNFKKNEREGISKFKLNEIPNKIKNGYITIGCFNRLNKITDSVIKIFNKIMIDFKMIRFVFKTKALINKNIVNVFLNKFEKNVRKRIEILDCTISHEDHILSYNNIDIAIDTFPYSGTTTTCESLFMGVPVFSLYDNKYFFHPQNVSCSILKNSNLEDYICDTQDELFKKIEELHKKEDTFWYNLKNETRNKFINGKVCDKENYIDNLQKLLVDLYNKHQELGK